MDESIRLGRIAGTQVGVDSSLLLISWLITWGLANGSVLPERGFTATPTTYAVRARAAAGGRAEVDAGSVTVVAAHRFNEAAADRSAP